MRVPVLNRRSFLLQAGVVAAVPLSGGAVAKGESPAAKQPGGASGFGRKEPVYAALDGFVPAYLEMMNGPGLTLGITDRQGNGGEAGYGLANLETGAAVTTELLFQIGSISKSFLAIVLLQMQEEGKLDFHRPALEYMPWLAIETPYGDVTVHHMLSHTSGLPGDAPVFPTNPTEMYRQSWKPGERFHYSNFCFQALGKLAASLDKRPLHVSIQKRILDPLGMKATSPVLTETILARTAESYTPAMRDRPFGPKARRMPAAKINSDSGAGAIASTPGDMRRYMQMILNRGMGPEKRILSEESFVQFSTAHVKAEEFGPTASYGYGIAVDTLNGHRILRHTGGMVSFMSAMHLDLDAGVGAFASINAQLDYRPNPVAQYAIELMRAEKEGKPLPSAPKLEDSSVVTDPAQYAGEYLSPEGELCRVTASADGLIVDLDGHRLRLTRMGGSRFLAAEEAYSDFAFVFRRESGTAGDGDKEGGEKGPMTVVQHGGRWFQRGAKPVAVALPERWAAYPGKYMNDSPWLGSFHVVSRKGQLWIEGETPLIELGAGEFRAGDEPDSPETIRFYHLVDGRAQMVKSGGADFWRITTEED